MLINLALGVATMAICLFLQSLLIVHAVRFYQQHARQVNNPSFVASLVVVNGVMTYLVVGNLGQVAIWAWLFQLLGEFEQFEAAFYHSMVNFATLGYGDIVMSEQHKLLGPLQAINGVLMIGVSTATLMATYQDAMKKTAEARRTQ